MIYGCKIRDLRDLVRLYFMIRVCVNACVCMCLCVREREKERVRESTPRKSDGNAWLVVCWDGN